MFVSLKVCSGLCIIRIRDIEENVEHKYFRPLVFERCLERHEHKTIDQ